MNMKNNKLLKRIKQKPIDPLWYQLRRLENTKILYEQNPNLPPNVRTANIQLVQNDIIALKKKLKRRTRFDSFTLSKI